MSHAVITDPAAWIGPKIQHDPSWVHYFDAAALAEIDTARQHARRAGARIPFTPAAFPLPRVAPMLQEILHEIEHGAGFKLLRGIPRERYSDADCELLYWGIGVHFGTLISQNGRGHLLGHVRDEGRTQADPNARAYQTNQRMDFHTDMLPMDLLMLTMQFEEGDIQLINNHTLLHAREAYEDWPQPGRERQLLRMWIAVDDAQRRPLAAALTERYRWVERGGIPVKAAQSA